MANRISYSRTSNGPVASPTGTSTTPASSVAAPLLVTRWPTELFHVLLEQICTGQSEWRAISDIRNLSLVSRSTHAAVNEVVASACGETLRDAWARVAEASNAARRLKRSLEFDRAARQPERKSFIPYFGKSRPPQALETLLKENRTVALDLVHTYSNAFLEALLKWGPQLPLSALTIACDAAIPPSWGASPERYFTKHLESIVDVLTVLGGHPDAKSLKVHLHVRGCGDVSDAFEIDGHFMDLYIGALVGAARASDTVKKIELFNVPKSDLWGRLGDKQGCNVFLEGHPLTADTRTSTTPLQ